MFCINGGKEYEKIYRCGFGINIVSGDGISVSYNDADTDYEYSESLYLKNADDDSILILSAEDGEEYEFKKTDMSSVPYYLR